MHEHTPEPTTGLVEDPMKTLIREVIAEGRKRKEFKQAVKKQLTKTGTGTREVISLRIKESHRKIDEYWKEIKGEEKTNG